MIVDLQPGDFYFTNVKMLGVYDGDTIYLDIDMGFHQHRQSVSKSGNKLKASYRLLRINAPELNTLATRVAGTESKNTLIRLLDGQALTVRTLPDPDSFGRYLIEIWLPDGTNVNDKMIELGQAVPYSK